MLSVQIIQLPCQYSPRQMVDHMPQFSSFHVSDPSKIQTFRGRPSKGCNKCRSRKVNVSLSCLPKQHKFTKDLRCDEGHPTCQRCEKSAFACVYRDEFDIFLRNQTDKTAEAAQKKWRSRSRKSPTEVITEIGCHVSTSPSSDQQERSMQLIPNTVPQAVSVIPALQDIAYSRFLFDYVITPSCCNPYSSFYGFVPKLCLNADANSPASAALSATAFAKFASRCRSEESKTRSVEEYDKPFSY